MDYMYPKYSTAQKMVNLTPSSHRPARMSTQRDE